MKMLILLMVGLATGAYDNGGEKTTYNVDVEKSEIKWEASKVTGKHNGRVPLKSGNLQYENDELVGGTFEIDLANLTVDDLSGNSKNKLEGHLRSPDFFAVEEFPTASFEITEVISRGTPGAYKVLGNVTIKGITKPIKFNTTITEEGDTKVATADITLDRSEFDVRYGSGSFFDNLGNRTIYDDFDLSISLVVTK